MFHFAFDQIALAWQSLATLFHVQIAERGFWELVLMFQIFLFGEMPRYVLPGVVLLSLKVFGIPRGNEEQRRRFMATKPRVSTLLVGLNEEGSIAKAIYSLLELEYDNMEIVVVDDNSTDRMYEVAKPFAEKGVIKLFKNSAVTGRGGRPSASNMAFQFSSGDYILSVDADTSFDRGSLEEMIGPFCDPRVGVVAGNLKVRNMWENTVTRMQSIEYLQSIGVWKSCLNLIGSNMQASGAFGAFRREEVVRVGAWDAELAEDADISLKIKKLGKRVVFSPRAIAMTDVPNSLKTLMKQRYRWDRGTLRTYLNKHGDLLRFWRFDWRTSLELLLDLFFTVFLAYVYIIWLGIMLVFMPKALIPVWIICYFLYVASGYVTLCVALVLSERRKEEWPLLFWVPLFPLYKELFRWVRSYALTLEIVRVNYEESYLPESAWRNTERW